MKVKKLKPFHLNLRFQRVQEGIKRVNVLPVCAPQNKAIWILYVVKILKTCTWDTSGWMQEKKTGIVNRTFVSGWC